MTKIEEICKLYNGVILERYPEYIITKIGEVYSIRREKFIDKIIVKRDPKVITSKCDVFVNLRVDGTSYRVAIHRLLALAFIPNPDMKETVNHIDGNPMNNSISNLEWMTQSENSVHAHTNGLVANRYTPCRRSIITYKEEEAFKFDSLVDGVKYLTGNDSSKSSGASLAALTNSNLASGDPSTKTAHGYVWRYGEPDKVELTSEFIENNHEDATQVEHKVITGFSRYNITEKGRVFDTLNNKEVKISKIKDSASGTYFARCTLIDDDGKERKLRLARLVASHFLKAWPNVGFKNGNTLDCRADNLKEVNPSKVNRPVVLYRKLWKEVYLDSFETVKHAAIACNLSPSYVSEVVQKNTSIPESTVEYSDSRVPFTAAGYILRPL